MSETKIKPCRKCGTPNPKVWDCGYSSFNVGGVKCQNPQCNHEVKVNCCGCFPEEELIAAWNDDKPTVEEQLVIALHKCSLLEKENRRLKRELKKKG